MIVLASAGLGALVFYYWLSKPTSSNTAEAKRETSTSLAGRLFGEGAGRRSISDDSATSGASDATSGELPEMVEQACGAQTLFYGPGNAPPSKLKVSLTAGTPLDVGDLRL